MTDNDIVKALECLCGIEIPCKDCAWYRFFYPVCKQQVAKDACDLINRQKEEILELKRQIENLEREAELKWEREVMHE